MFLKITRSGPRKYLQIVQAYHDPETGRPKQRYIGSLGRVDQLERRDLDTLIDGLLKVTGRPTLGEIGGGITSENTVFEPALSLGDVWAIFSIWRELRLAQTIVREVRRRRHRMDIEQLVRVMVTNRLSDPRSKLGVELPRSSGQVSTWAVGRWMEISPFVLVGGLVAEGGVEAPGVVP